LKDQAAYSRLNEGVDPWQEPPGTLAIILNCIRGDELVEPWDPVGDIVVWERRFFSEIVTDDPHIFGQRRTRCGSLAPAAST
jgi:hypothetical protein